MTTQKPPPKNMRKNEHTEHMIIKDDYILIDTMYHITPSHQLLHKIKLFNYINIKGHLSIFVNS